MVEMGDLFGFSLYFETFSDHRGRMYPLFFLFSRTTGFYKYLLKFFSSGEQLSERGLIRMLEAYYLSVRKD
jgi:hypothetical protein